MSQHLIEKCFESHLTGHFWVLSFIIQGSSACGTQGLHSQYTAQPPALLRGPCVPLLRFRGLHVLSSRLYEILLLWRRGHENLLTQSSVNYQFDFCFAVSACTSKFTVKGFACEKQVGIQRTYFCLYYRMDKRQ